MKNDSTTVKSAHSKGIASFLYAHRVDVEDPLRCMLSTRLHGYSAYWACPVYYEASQYLLIQ